DEAGARVRLNSIRTPEDLKAMEDELASAMQKTDALGQAIKGAKQIEGSYENARYFRDVVFRDMEDLRRVCDKLERMTSREVWPFPVYGDILFSVK
ncbi:MAG: hypothetical protein J6P40_06305, partial [Oscillospiraceae bacterium]|nr:hypothetical protein [Oscillospiraceae bacterium]